MDMISEIKELKITVKFKIKFKDLLEVSNDPPEI